MTARTSRLSQVQFSEDHLEDEDQMLQVDYQYTEEQDLEAIPEYGENF